MITTERTDNQITVREDASGRGITGTVTLDDEGRQLQLSVSHDKSRKHYRVILWRQEFHDGVVTVSMFEDSQYIDNVPTARYSLKKLREVFEDYKVALNDEDYLSWGRAKSLRN